LPPPGVDPITLVGPLDPYRLVLVLVRLLGAPVGESLGEGTTVWKNEPSEYEPMYERTIRTSWTIGRIEVEHVEWVLYDPNDRWDASGTSRVVWRLRGLAEGRELHLYWSGNSRVFVTPSADPDLIALVHAAAAAARP
jgi:hypothetical protein